MRILIACLLILPMALLAQAGVQTWQRTYSVNGSPSVVAHINDGPIDVSVWSQPQVQVTVALHRSGWCSLTMDQVRVQATQTGNRIQVEVHAPSMRLVFGSCGLSMQVNVPKQATLHLATGDGHVQVAGVQGSLGLETGDGSIHVTGADGELHANTGDGSVQAEGRFSHLRLHTGDGSIHLQADAGSRMEGEWDIETGDGSIDLGLPRDFSARIDAHTGDGRIRSDLPITVSGGLDRQTLRGTLHGGTSTLRLRSGDGSIRLSGTL